MSDTATEMKEVSTNLVSHKQFNGRDAFLIFS